MRKALRRAPDSLPAAAQGSALLCLEGQPCSELADTPADSAVVDDLAEAGIGKVRDGTSQSIAVEEVEELEPKRQVVTSGRTCHQALVQAEILGGDSGIANLLQEVAGWSELAGARILEAACVQPALEELRTA